ncbi:aryl-sulfate sulfotransferase [Lapidilactobacillus concavus]|uniref:aryl-sulfate sulfotransferase n=1 Tax=Lapidilactobacillus concavus TaxID=287844 RepID=UPI00070E5CA1|nr:aryl-sulfate sulfotransferase [Lapidilactobacillus concavus]GEL13624.1 aryl-sulfate sulfotransferase [Lapidilactobacillus concavus]
MKRRKIWWLSALSLIVVVAGALVGWHLYQYRETLSAAQIRKNLASELITTRQQQQAALTKTYQQALNSEKYIAAQPYIKVNPYQTSPLTALVIFQTAKASQVSLEVVGKTAKTSIKTTYPGYRTKHQLSVLGLYAATNNEVRLTIKQKNGTTTHQTLHIQTAKLPTALATIKINVKTADKQKMVIGDDKLTFVVRTTKQPFAIDADGEIRWYSTDYSQHVFKVLQNGHLLRLAKRNNQALVYNELLETDYLGRVYREYHFSGKTKSSNSQAKDDDVTVVHHDAIELPNKDLLLTVSDGGNKYIEDTMVQVSHKTGKITKVIDMKKILPTKMWQDFDAMKRSDGKIDWLHQNSIYYDQTDQSIVISSRHQDLVMKLDYKTLQIKWLFSGQKAASWPLSYRDKLLKITGKTSYPGGQHAAILLPTKTASKKTLILFNNNIAIVNGPKKTSGKYSEGIQYTLNEKTKTITQTWAYGQSLGKANFSPIIGSARYLSATNRLLCFGYLDSGAHSNIIEVDQTTNQPVFDVELSNLGTKGYTYRSERFSLYPTHQKNTQTYE